MQPIFKAKMSNMQPILVELLLSFYIGVPCTVYSATYNLIFEMYGDDAKDYFSTFVKATKNVYYFRDGSPTAGDFIREFEKIS